MATIPHTQNENLAPNVNVRKLRSGQWLDYSMDKSCDWIRELLVELNENAPAEFTEEQKLGNSELNIDIKLKKTNRGSIGDYLLCHLSLNSTFNTLCVKTGTPITDHISFDIKICFIPSEHEEEEEYKEQTEIFTDGEVYELYFLNKNWEAPLQEVIHEQLYLNMDYYPSIDGK